MIFILLDKKVEEKGQEVEQKAEVSNPTQADIEQVQDKGPATSTPPQQEPSANVFNDSDDEDEKPRRRFARRGSDSD